MPPSEALSTPLTPPLVPFGFEFGGRGVTPRLLVLYVLFPSFSGFSSSSSFGASVGDASLSLADRANDVSLPVFVNCSACRDWLVISSAPDPAILAFGILF